MQSRTSGFGTALAVSLTLGLTGCAAPEPPPEDVRPADREDDDRLPHRPPAFRALDADGDGGLSAAEIDAAPESLAALDADGDGRLSGGELGLPIGAPARILARPAGVLREQIPEGATVITLDADADALDVADLPPQFRGLLSSVDADGDGAVSGTELLALTGAEAGGPAGPQPESAEGRMPLLAALDADRDGAVSGAEMESAAQSLRALDADGDGRIAPDELRPASSGGGDGSRPRK